MRIQSLAVALTATSATCLAATNIAGAVATSGLILPKASTVPGGIYIAPVEGSPGKAPIVTYDGKRAMVIRSGGRWVAVVGLPLTATVGPGHIQVESGEAPEVAVTFSVSD